MGIITLQYRQGRNKNWIMSWPCILWSGFQILDITVEVVGRTSFRKFRHERTEQVADNYIIRN